MNKTRKTFMLAGSIVSLVYAGVLALCLKNKPVEVVEAPEETVVVSNE